MEKFENGIFEYSDAKKVPSLVEIENAYRRARVNGADKFAVVINDEYFGYNPQKRGIYKLNDGEYQSLNAVAPAQGEQAAAEVETSPVNENAPTRDWIIGVDEKAEQEHFVAPENPHALELLGELETAIRELVSENKERDREIAELKNRLATLDDTCDRYKELADRVREIGEMLK